MDNFIELPPKPELSGREIAFVGRLSHEKGPDYMLDLARAAPDLELHLYGDGPMADELAAAAPSNLHLHGLQSDMASVWHRIGTLLMPSRYEGLPMAALEAMGRGIPVMGFDVGALPKLLADGGGQLVQPGCTEQLLDALRAWLGQSEADQAAVREQARAVVRDRFSTDAQLPRLLSIYASANRDAFAVCADASLQSAKRI